MSKRVIKTYTTEVKEEAIKLATEIGLTKASKELREQQMITELLKKTTAIISRDYI